MRRRPDNDGDNGFAEWGGYMEAKKSKLADQFEDNSSKEAGKLSNIFNGISVFVNGYTNPSSEEIKRMMMLHGGIYHFYLRPGKTKYIIASNLPDSKVKQLGPNDKIVKPTWISESVSAGKLLDYREYLLYTHHSKNQAQLNFIRTDSEKSILNNEGIHEKEKKEIDHTRSTRTAVDPKFLSEFYNNSRLHLISTLAVTFKQHITDLREKSDGTFPTRQLLNNYSSNLNKERNFEFTENDKIIMHIDMDCFFVSVGLRNRPELRGKPVAVTHGRSNQKGPVRPGADLKAEIEFYNQRLQNKVKSVTDNLEPNVEVISRLNGIEASDSMSEIASCSYEARRVGLKNGMFLGAALKLCPELKTIPYDFEGYREVAYILYNTVALYTLNIEAVSCDEMFVDVTDLLRDTNISVYQWADYIRSEIRKKTDCPCSTGFGANRLQARLATRKAKPDGQYYLRPEDVQQYMTNVDIESLPGVGRSLAFRLKSTGLKTCGDLQNLLLPRLKSEFGNRIGEDLYSHCRGIDHRPLSFDHLRKSVSAEVNYGIRFKNNTEAETFLKQLCQEVYSRLSEINMKGKCITLKYLVRAKDAPVETAKFMGHGVCDSVTKSSTLPHAVSDLSVIMQEVMTIARKLAVTPSELRGIGIQISRLEKINKITKNNALTKFLIKSKSTEKIFPETESIKIVRDSVSAQSADTTKIEKNIDIKKTDDKKVINNSTMQKRNRRGRPPKNSKNSGKIKESSQSLSHLFNTQSNQQKKNNVSTFAIQKGTKLKSPIKKGLEIDTNVLLELPYHIRSEILNDYKINVKHLSNLTTDQDNLTDSVNNSNELKNIRGSEIDKNILAELPDDIRSEIISTYKIDTSISIENPIPNEVQNNSDNYDSDILEISANNSPNRNEEPVQPTSVILEKYAQDEKNKTETSINCDIFLEITFDEQKRLLTEWFNLKSNPHMCDVTVLSDYCQKLATSRKIERLNKLVKFLHRNILKSGNCEWHQAYYKIIEKLQSGMLLTYNSKLMVNMDIGCIKCKPR